MKRFRFTFALIVLCLGLAVQFPYSPPSRAAAPAIDWPELSLDPYLNGLIRPVHITHAGDGSDRLFIVEQAGKVRIAQGGVLLDPPFLDITSKVLSPANGGGNEEGLLSIAFPPDYVNKGHFYVYYNTLESNIRISRFRVSPDPNQADPNTELPILDIQHPINENHNGGQLAFGPDDYLYIGSGDGGGGGDPGENAQDPTSLLGKLLRIDVESGIEPYSIPSTNPFTQTAVYRGEIWALGLRNPWRFSFDRLTGDLFIGDVGQNRWEEIDYQPAASSGGENYGWDILEGTHCFEPPNGCLPPVNYSAPIFEYEHYDHPDFGTFRSVTGGRIYRGNAYPRMQGIYFLADAVTGEVWGLKWDGVAWQSQHWADFPTGYGLVSFGEDESGEIYAADMYAGEILHLEDAPLVPLDNFHYLPITVR